MFGIVGVKFQFYHSMWIIYWLELTNKTKSCLGSKFEIKDMREVSYVLGITITRDQSSRWLYLDQSKYIEKVLERFNMENYKTLSTPINKGQHMDRTMCPKNK